MSERQTLYPLCHLSAFTVLNEMDYIFLGRQIFLVDIYYALVISNCIPMLNGPFCIQERLSQYLFEVLI